jgi:hypothetical protein
MATLFKQQQSKFEKQVQKGKAKARKAIEDANKIVKDIQNNILLANNLNNEPIELNNYTLLYYTEKLNHLLKIQRNVKAWLSRIHKLPTIKYNGTLLSYKSINAFRISQKNVNDKNNKLRENIIGSIINNKIPEPYFKNSLQWNKMKTSINNYLKNDLLKNCDDNDNNDNNEWNKIQNINLIHKGGRKFNYDMEIIFTFNDNSSKKYFVELKFNAQQLADAPQFVSPMKPSTYLEKSYEEYFYDIYLPQISNFSGISMPSKEDYLNQIHQDIPPCMKPFQDLYYKGSTGSSRYTGNENDVKFYKECIRISKDSISTFITNYELDFKKLSAYFKTSQQNKKYMLYFKNKFYYEDPCLDDYEIVKVVKNSKTSRYDCYNKKGKNIKVLLRWKNGNGIAFPAFQVSYSDKIIKS